MKTNPYAAQQYHILPHKYFDSTHYVLYRKLPIEEYLQYYTDRKNEIYVDEFGNHWLWLNGYASSELAQKELYRITGSRLRYGVVTQNQSLEERRQIFRTGSNFDTHFENR